MELSGVATPDGSYTTEIVVTPQSDVTTFETSFWVLQPDYTFFHLSSPRARRLREPTDTADEIQSCPGDDGEGENRGEAPTAVVRRQVEALSGDDSPLEEDDGGQSAARPAEGWTRQTAG